MRRSIKSTLVSLLGAAIGLISSAQATDYYVSPSGSDANDGKTPQTAWQTISRAVSASESFQPGDKVSFKGGTTFEGIIMTSNNGIANQPITFTTYGLGKAKIISHTNKPAIYLNSNKNIVFQGLEVSSAQGRGVLLSETKEGSSHILFDKIDIRTSGLEGFAATNPNDSDITLQNCTIDNVGGHAVSFYGKSITLKGNHIKGNGIKPAISLSGVQKAIIEGNEVVTPRTPKPIFIEMDRKPAFYIADRNKWDFPGFKTMYEGFVANKKAMPLSEFRRYTGQHANDNKQGSGIPSSLALPATNAPSVNQPIQPGQTNAPAQPYKQPIIPRVYGPSGIQTNSPVSSAYQLPEELKDDPRFKDPEFFKRPDAVSKWREYTNTLYHISGGDTNLVKQRIDKGTSELPKWRASQTPQKK
jgi:hypothetical protein